jgi:hypothetical protein
VRAFQSYLLLGPHKAFATSAHFFGLSVARITTEDARKRALDNCKQAAQKNESCAVVSVDNAEVHP